LAVAGIFKLVDAGQLHRALMSIGFEGAWIGILAVLVVALELACAAACLVGAFSRLLTLTLVGMFLAFTVVLVVLRVDSGTSTCGCFGSVFAGTTIETFEFAIARNALMLSLLVAPGVLDRWKRTQVARRNGMGGHATTSVFVALIIAIVTCTTGTARAQSDLMDAPWHPLLERRLNSSIDRRHVDQFIAHFDLSGAQADLAIACWLDHVERFDEFRSVHQEVVHNDDRVDRIRTLPHGGATIERIEVLAALAEEEVELAAIADAQEALDERLLRDLRALLLSEQVEARWPSYLEWLNRERWLRTGQAYPGDGITLCVLLDGMNVSADDLTCPPVEFEQLMHAYSRVFNDALVKRAQFEVAQSRQLIRFVLRNEKASRPLYVYDESGAHIDTTTSDPGFRDVSAKQHATRLALVNEVHDIQVKFRQSVRERLVPDRAREFQQRFVDLVIAKPPPRAEAYVNDLLARLKLDEVRRNAIQASLDECLRRFRRNCIDEYELIERQAELRFTTTEFAAAGDARMTEITSITEKLHELGGERITIDDRVMRFAWSLLTESERADVPKQPLWTTD